jgi:hypothetical protein
LARWIFPFPASLPAQFQAKPAAPTQAQKENWFQLFEHAEA